MCNPRIFHLISQELSLAVPQWYNQRFEIFTTLNIHVSRYEGKFKFKVWLSLLSPGRVLLQDTAGPRQFHVTGNVYL